MTETLRLGYVGHVRYSVFRNTWHFVSRIFDTR